MDGESSGCSSSIKAESTALEFVQNLGNRAFVDQSKKSKNGQDYIPWALLWAEAKKQYPGMYYMYEIHDKYVKVLLFLKIHGPSTVVMLAMTDHRNRALDNPTAVDAQNTVMRALAKAISMATGLGLSLWFGDLQAPLAPEDDPVRHYSEKIASCKTREALEKLSLELAALPAKTRLGKRDLSTLRKIYEEKAAKLV